MVANEGQHSVQEKIPAAVATVSVVPASVEMPTSEMPPAIESATAEVTSTSEVASTAEVASAVKPAPSTYSSAETAPPASSNLCHGARRVTDTSQARRCRPHRFVNAR
jgi:hypothetical protein